LRYFLSIFVLFSLCLYGETLITKQWLQNKPRSYAKDFYIWRYLNQNITPDDAIWALGEAKNVNNKLFRRYANKLHHKSTSRIVQCMKMKPSLLYKQDADCIKNGLTAYKATKLTKKQLLNVSEKIDKQYPKLANVLKILSSNKPFDRLVQSDNKLFFDTFNQVGTTYRIKYFNHKFSNKLLTRLKSDKKKFAVMIKKIVTTLAMGKAQQSLFDIDTKNLSHQTSFFLAINSIRYNQLTQAIQYLQQSYKTAYFRFDKDKVLFWQYKISHDKSYLRELALSWDINIYSLFAKELLHIEPHNIKFGVKLANSDLTSYDISDPFAWLAVLRHIKKLDKQKLLKYKSIFTTQQTQGHISFIQERYDRYKIAYFAKPYDMIIKNYSIERQALIYALARQESRFIPTSISPSYALGVMQIMPFLSKALAKQLKEQYDIDKQLIPSINIKYANKHLNYLERKLNHNVLLIAYAYNGGIGFTKRMLKNGFFKLGKYDPYISMELIPYDESRRYGKKVLANYIIYYNNLAKNKKISILKDKFFY